VLDAVPGPESNSPRDFIVVGGQLFFVGGVTSLWRSDGTVGGTQHLRFFYYRTSRPYAPQNLTAFAGALWFAADDQVAGVELWRSDGSVAGTTMAFDLRVGAGSSMPRALTVFGSRLYFIATTDTEGEERRYTDGTPSGAGTFDLVPGPASSSPAELAVLGDRLYFTAIVGGSSHELWSTDGSAAGTQRVSSAPREVKALHAAGERLFFHAVDAAGREPWVSDGTNAGTQRLGDLRAGIGASMRETDVFTRAGAGTLVLFVADDELHRREPWSSDGTPAGTRLLADLAPGRISSSPSDFARVGSAIYFSADDSIHGSEPWIVSLATLGATLAEPYGSGCAGTGGSAPRLAPRGVPRVGNPSFGFSIDNARPSAATLGLFALRRQALGLGICELLVDAPLLMSLAATLDAQGRALVVVPLAQDPAFLGAEVFVQWLVEDPAGYLGAIALTNGLHILVGN
jgi:ELWxxDGT repeat protein